MLHNVPLISHKHGDLTIEGFSRAAVQTCWRIAELKVNFDLGVQPWDFMGTPCSFISHAHLDHLAALPVYVSRRRMMKMDPPTIYMPASAVAGSHRLLQTFAQLDRGSMPCEIIGVEPGDEIELSRELVVKVVATRHTIPSVGYLISQRRHKLKPQYLELSGPEIRQLKLDGVEITHEIRVPILGFTGDTSPPGLDQNPELFKAKVLITEMTFVAPEHRKDKIHKHGHMHLDDFVARRDHFENELVIASHFSTRYSDPQIRRWVERALPDMLDGRLRLWL
ncbi:MBL fold metallo-hydrolase [Candidatus Laterigemmans baculatus]|uniref:MBL fold metallo-hydrolase n=1 Tax=Candidatus Laterigemmans baculatus TaxID=2770505 RepID=UPI0013DD5BA6|nr:MBL fold metallo-hydrolase [Candidatus Laterigemmans baculatus]